VSLISAPVHRTYRRAALAAAVCLCFAAEPALGRQSQEPAHPQLESASPRTSARPTAEVRPTGASTYGSSASTSDPVTRGEAGLSPSVFWLKDRGTYLGGITQGPDGNLWVTESGPSPGEIASVTPTGEVTEFAIPTSDGGADGITSGPDGNLWFTEKAAGKIGRITPAGKITEFSLPSGSGSPTTITDGPDGDLWFTEEAPGKIGRMTSGGEVTEFSLPASGSAPRAITVGPERNLWFGEKDAIGRITPSGQVIEFPLPSNTGEVRAITTGADGNLWFTATAHNKKLEEEAAAEEEWGIGYGWQARIGRITPAGDITEFDLPNRERADGITAGPEGDLWFATEQSALRSPWQGTIDRISPLGRITQFAESGAAPSWITLGSGGSIWYTTNGGPSEFLYGPTSGALERITPPSLETFIEIPSTPDNVYRHWTRQKLTCGNGTSATSCRGVMRLSYEPNRSHGSQRGRIYRLARRYYKLSSESSRFFTLHLTNRALTIMQSHKGVLRCRLRVTDRGGQGASREVFLVR
jgi:streptogramin lyase